MSVNYDTVQRSRLCVLANDKNAVLVSASVVATIVVRLEGSFSATLAPGVPVLWITEGEIVNVGGDASWDEVVRRISFGLLSITFSEWSEEKVLAIVQQKYPAARLQPLAIFS